jgi:hypothetical protein
MPWQVQTLALTLGTLAAVLALGWGEYRGPLATLLMKIGPTEQNEASGALKDLGLRGHLDDVGMPRDGPEALVAGGLDPAHGRLAP